MLFNSFQFLFLFLPVTLAGALWLERRSQAAFIWWLIVASLVFYGVSSPQYLWFLCLSVIVNYATALLIERSVAQTRRFWLIAGLAWNLSLLGYFKYTNFLGATIGDVTGHDLGWAYVVLPVGISFFTFQKIAFLVDTYRGDTISRSFARFALFVFFFPQLIAGPIVHHAEFIPQLDRKRRQRLENVAIGLVVLSIGLLKKMYIADTAAIPATAIFDAAAAATQPGFADAWLGAFAYTVQIYFDFSGYSDMAVGLARMFGIDLPINFASPYKATSIVDFWRRWHITLSRFLRDYLYIPLGGNRHGPLRQRLNLMLTMVLGGIWHGAGWTFLLGGFLHGLYLLIAHAFARTAIGNRLGRLRGWATAMRILTFVAVVIAWVPFRAVDLGTTFRIWAGMLSFHDTPFAGFALAHAKDITPVAIGLVIAFFGPNTYELLAQMRVGLPSPGYPASYASPAVLPWKLRFTQLQGVVAGLAVAAIILKMNDISAFIYFHF
jgi:D-alanyl-lipoteichoic acid acyltransferase DltB (MBOAT superfamily)